MDGTNNTILLGDANTVFTVTPLTASRLIATDASKDLESVTDLTTWIAGSGITVTDDTDGTVTLSLPDPLVIPGKLTAGSFAFPTDVTNTRQYGCELHYSGNNYNVTAIRARAQLVTTDTVASAQGALLQAANNDNINVGVLNGALIEAIGKADTNAATITMMRGCLVNTEWSAKDTVTDLRVLHVRTHTRDAVTEGYVSGTGYGIYIENEAVGGNGQALNAGIYFKSTNLSAGNSAFTYGIDFSGGTYGTTEIKLKDGGTLGSSGASVNIDSSGNVNIPHNAATITLQWTGTGSYSEIQFKEGSSYVGFIGGFGSAFGQPQQNNLIFTNAANNNGGFLFRTRTSSSYQNRVKILNAGNVGINTITPDTKLQVVGDCKFGDDSGNHTKVEADGTIEFNGDATVWNDIQFPLSGAKVPASNAPTWETFTTNTKEYGFAVDDYIDTQANEIFHGWKLGTAGDVHLHITTKAANSTGSNRFAKFQIWISYCDTGETWQETNFTAELTIPDGTAALEMFYLDMGDLTLTNYIIEAELKLRVKRIAATGGTEYSGNIFITEAGIHIESDMVGSRQESTK